MGTYSNNQTAESEGKHAGDIADELDAEFADYSATDFDVTMRTSKSGDWDVKVLRVPEAMEPLSSSQKDSIESVIGWRP